MAAIEEWRAAVVRRNKIKDIKDFAQIGGNEVVVTLSAFATKAPGASPVPVDSEIRDFIAVALAADPMSIINTALAAARADVTAKAALARAEAEAVIRDTN